MRGGWLGFVWMGLLGGCAHAPPGPSGPLLGSGVKVQGNSYWVARSMAITTADSGGALKSSEFAGGGIPLLPHRLGVRGSWNEWSDIGVDATWLDVGIDARVGGARSEVVLPWAASVGGRTGELGVQGGASRESWDARGRFEVYPQLSNNWEVVISCGASLGRRWDFVTVEVQDNFARDWISVTWRDARLEGGLGIGYYADPEGSVAKGLRLLVIPYVPLSTASGIERAGASNTGDVVTMVQQDFGVVVLLDYWVFVGL